MRKGRLRFNKRPRIVAALVLIGVAVGAASWVGVAVGGSSSEDSATQDFYSNLVANGVRAEPTESIPQALSSDLSILREQPDPPSPVPDAVAAVGGETKLARPAVTTSDGDTVYVVPADGGLCIASSLGRAFACFPTDRVLAGQTASSIVCSPSLPPELVEVSGVLPDDARDVRAELSDGTSMDIAVANNVYVVHIRRSDPLPTRIEWDSADGHQWTSSTVPPGAADADCATPEDLARAKAAAAASR